MCGIIGYFAKGERVPERSTFERAIDRMIHRGPDGRGLWMSGRVGLGFRRLSIIDLATGEQPMSNEDKTLHIVFNGEIYNFQSLRERLEAKGHRFGTKSDTETILHLYEEEGEDCVKSLRGMFAFCIYDQRKNLFFLARDRFGKKPLFYSETSTGFYFASEIPALLQLADCSRDVDFSAIDGYFSLNYVPGSSSAWKEVRQLPAASVMRVIHANSNPPSCYWSLNWTTPVRIQSRDESISDFRAKFEESVRLRMISDVPLGAFLSGGVDSSITVAAMCQHSSRVQTFCIGFEDQKFDESTYAREVSKRLGTQHHEIRVAADSLDSLDSLIECLGEPFADQSLLPTYMLSAFTRKHVTVALSGDGGDELFAGYKRYSHLIRAEKLERLGLAAGWKMLSRHLYRIEQIFNPKRRSLQWPRSATDQILGLSASDKYLRLMGGWNREDRRSFWKRDSGNDLSSSWIENLLSKHADLQGLDRWQALDIETYLIHDILRKLDVATMASSLEGRCPLLDHQVAECAVRLPIDLKRDWRGRTKILLKNLYPDLLPPHLFEREKKGFSMPIGRWMRNQWKEIVQQTIEGSWDSGLEDCFDRNVLKKFWKEHQEGSQDHGNRLWSWLVLFRWNQRFQPNWK